MLRNVGLPLQRYDHNSNALTTMKKYIFYTTEGYTVSPSNSEVENCQVLGWARGTTPDEALKHLLEENAWILETGFNTAEIVAMQVV